jgi:hypothetical protein
MPPRCRSKGKKVLYKVLSSDEDKGGLDLLFAKEEEDHAKDAATEEPTT